MNKFTMLAAIVMLSCSLFADGRFVVTQYNLNFEPSHLGQVDHIINTPSLWDGAPITATYHTISFANNPWSQQPDAITYFTTRSFPGWKLSWKSDDWESFAWFATKIVGKVSIPREGFWTFAMGHDDGFTCRIFRGDHQFVFSAEGDTWLSGAREIKTIEFPEVGLYNIEILHYQKGGPALLEFSMAEGSHTSFRSSVFKLVEAAEGNYAVSFNANGGTGAMECQVFKESAKEKLLKNAYQKAGYVFQGWVTNSAERAELAANGTIDVDYKDEELISVDSDMTLYAVWANPAMTLTAESVDWSSGSITLRCEDADTSNATHKYSLEYKNESGIWTNVNDEAAINIERSSDGFAHLTDNMFWSRLGGVSSVAYRVKDENGRISEMCVTRYRHGLFVAIDAYQNGWQTSLSGPEIPEIYTSTHLARSFRRAYEQQGKAHGYRCLLGTSGSLAWKKTILKQMDYIAEQVAAPGDVVLFYYCGHGDMGRLTCYGEEEYLYASDLSNVLQRSAAKGAGIVAIIDACRSASVITQSAIGGTENVGWIVASQANESSWDDYFAEAICYKGWINGFADRIEAYGNEDGIVTFGELALFGQEYMGDSYDKHGQIMSFWNSLVLDHMVAGRTPSQERISNQSTWLKQFTGLFTASSGDIAKVAAMTAANGRMTVSDCFDCGVNPEDPDDDFKITHFEIKDGKPVIEMNHTEDGSGNSFEDRVKILGKAELTDTEWQEVPPEGNPEHRFFKVGVEIP